MFDVLGSTKFHLIMFFFLQHPASQPVRFPPLIPYLKMFLLESDRVVKIILYKVHLLDENKLIKKLGQELLEGNKQ